MSDWVFVPTVRAIGLSSGPELALDPEYPYNLANLRIRVLNFLPLPIDVRKVAFQAVRESFVVGDFEPVPEEPVPPLIHRELYVSAPLSDSQARLTLKYLSNLPSSRPGCALFRLNSSLHYSTLLGEHRCTLQGDRRARIHYGQPP